jgi:hypothetical protein
MQSSSRSVIYIYLTCLLSTLSSLLFSSCCILPAFSQPSPTLFSSLLLLLYLTCLLSTLSTLLVAGSYTDYLEYRRDDAQFKKEEAMAAKKELAAANNAPSKTTKKAEIVEVAVLPSTPVAAPSAGSKLSYNERKEFNKLEKEIEKLGVQIGDFEDKLAAASASGQGYSALAELTEKMNSLVMQREIKEQRWMELADGDE